MKFIVLSLVLLLLVGCGGQVAQKPKLPADTDLRADLNFKDVDGARTAFVTFYYTYPVSPSSKTPAPLQPLEVEEARLDGELLTPAVGDAGNPYYTTSTIVSRAPHTVTAKLGGRNYEGKISIYTTLESRGGSGMLNPK